MKQYALAFSVSLISAGAVMAQPVIDGTADASYGPALFTQNTDTGFGNNVNPDPRNSSAGSEIDQVFGTVDGGFLYLMITGNLESIDGEGPFNKLEIFIDSEAGGVNVLDGLNLPTAVDGHCCRIPFTQLPDPTSGALQRLSGLTFDAGFTADHYITFSNGIESGIGGPLGVSGWIGTTHYAELGNGSAGASSAVGGVLDPFGDALAADRTTTLGLPLGTIIDQTNNDPVADPMHEFFEPVDLLLDPNNDLNHREMLNDIGLLMAVDQTNITGVNGSGGPDFSNTGDPENVLTGFEFAIPLALLGNPAGDIKVTAFVNGSGHDFLANQITGGFVPDQDPLSPTFGQVLVGNLASPNLVNLATLDGDQFVTISQAVAALDGDYNGDGFVGIEDLNLVLGNWTLIVTPGNLLQGDGFDDPLNPGFIGIEDLNIVLGNWNAGVQPPPGSVVPEPTTLALLGLGGVAMLRRRR